MEIPGRTFMLQSERRLKATPEELTAIILDPEQLSYWGRAVFMECEVLDRGDRHGLGMATRSYAKGLLPHAFIVSARISALIPHKSMRVDVWGDLEGFAELEVLQESEELRVKIVWQIDCRHRIIGPITRLAPFIFKWNHRFTLSRGFSLMQREIDRRRAGASPRRPSIPTFPHNFPWLRRFFYRSRVAT
jgi:hypothetical protein